MNGFRGRFDAVREVGRVFGREMGLTRKCPHAREQDRDDVSDGVADRHVPGVERLLKSNIGFNACFAWKENREIEVVLTPRASLLTLPASQLSADRSFQRTKTSL